jgi:hypothetical protein
VRAGAKRGSMAQLASLLIAPLADAARSISPAIKHHCLWRAVGGIPRPVCAVPHAHRGDLRSHGRAMGISQFPLPPQWLASASCYRRAHPGHRQRDLSVILWELSRLDRFPDDEVREACICASGSLDEAAWELYAPSVSYQDTGADP